MPSSDERAVDVLSNALGGRMSETDADADADADAGVCLRSRFGEFGVSSLRQLTQTDQTPQR